MKRIIYSSKRQESSTGRDEMVYGHRGGEAGKNYPVPAGALEVQEESPLFQMSRRPTFPTMIYTGFTGLNAVSPASSYPLETWT